ncbi:MAG: hypothetical protein NC254_07915 [bacterium]|nr:hypothetical protein [bacterium]
MGEQAWEKPALWNASKLRIPKEASWWLRRDKLLSSIESGDECAVVFHAGAGYGKTTVMAEWAGSHRARSCWYRLHESDNHFYRFLYGIAAALSSAVNVNFFDGGKMKLTGREKPERVSELFFSRCIPALPGDGFFICLDDLHLIYDEAVLDFLLRFMEYGEGRARFFFSLRGSFPGFLAACLMRGTAREIKEDELRFEERETALLLHKMAGRELPQKTVREIHADTNGWPAGIAFAGLDLKEVRPLPARTPLFDRTRLYDYLFYEIFRKLAYDTQQFLTESSALEVVTPSLCNHALGRGDAVGMLRYLVRENLFLSHMSGEDDAYCYDGVFRDFLRSRLPAGRRGEILLRAAEYEVRHGAWEAAVGYGMQCGEKGCALVAAVLEKRAAGMAESGQHTLLRVWIDHLYGFRDRLPDTALYCMYEQLYRDGERQRGEELLRAAVKQARAKLRYDSSERYLRELAALEKETAQEGIGTLSVQCMGSLSVRGAGGEIVWRTKKTKELFACLFYEKGRWVSRDVLTERLWPEKTAEKAAVLFHTTASYLRKALAGAGGADCLLVKNQSYALNMTRMQSDVEELDRCYGCLKRGEMLSGERAAKLAALYGAGYLYEEDYLWIGAYGEEMERRYLWMMNTLADKASAEKKHEEAAAYLKKALEVDGYALAVMERLVECLLLCRDITGAKRAYERLREASLEVIGGEPERTFEEYLYKN